MIVLSVVSGGVKLQCQKVKTDFMVRSCDMFSAPVERKLDLVFISVCVPLTHTAGVWFLV